MAIQTWKCLECGKEFKPGDYLCAGGVKHSVESKRYYMDDAPTHTEWRDGRPFINKGASQTIVLNVPPERKERDGDEVRTIPGGSVTFVRGMFETADPEIQFYLDRKNNLCSEARWRDVYLNDDEKINIRNLELAARESRLQERENELLASVKGKAKSA